MKFSLTHADLTSNDDTSRSNDANVRVYGKYEKVNGHQKIMYMRGCCGGGLVTTSEQDTRRARI